MKHPNEAKLALYASRDLGPLARWQTRIHLAQCDRCRSEVEAFDDLRAEIDRLNELPGMAWNRMAAEMQANIRLGLAAGECVREPGSIGRFRLRLPTRPKALVAYTAAAALVLAGLIIERPAPPPVAEHVNPDTVLQATSRGIELQEGGHSITLMHGRARQVTYSVGAQGALRGRYVDDDTGYVTINSLYAQ